MLKILPITSSPFFFASPVRNMWSYNLRQGKKFCKICVLRNSLQGHAVS